MRGEESIACKRTSTPVERNMASGAQSLSQHFSTIPGLLAKKLKKRVELSVVSRKHNQLL